MIFDELLREKYRVQKALAEAAGDDVDQYFALVHQLALDTQKQLGLTFKYAVPTGFIPPTLPQVEANLLPT